MASYSYCGNLPVLSGSAIPQTTPTIENINITIGDINTEQSYIIPNGTKKILIKHRLNGKIEFSFTTGLVNYVEVPKGASYTETDLNTQNETIFYRTDKIGTIEILTWK
jgi:hypothetical protein